MYTCLDILPLRFKYNLWLIKSQENENYKKSPTRHNKDMFYFV